MDRLFICSLATLTATVTARGTPQIREWFDRKTDLAGLAVGNERSGVVGGSKGPLYCEWIISSGDDDFKRSALFHGEVPCFMSRMFRMGVFIFFVAVLTFFMDVFHVMAVFFDLDIKRESFEITTADNSGSVRMCPPG